MTETLLFCSFLALNRRHHVLLPPPLFVLLLHRIFLPLNILFIHFKVLYVGLCNFCVHKYLHLQNIRQPLVGNHPSLGLRRTLSIPPISSLLRNPPVQHVTYTFCSSLAETVARCLKQVNCKTEEIAPVCNEISFFKVGFASRVFLYAVFGKILNMYILYKVGHVQFLHISKTYVSKLSFPPIAECSFVTGSGKSRL